MQWSPRLYLQTPMQGLGILAIVSEHLFSLRLHTAKTTFNMQYRFGPDFIRRVLTHLQLPFPENLPAFCLLALVMKFSSA
tara:strand:- start:151 stop:390 length:240 start_codon:yes stop_codon:yes gene_type:complete